MWPIRANAAATGRLLSARKRPFFAGCIKRLRLWNDDARGGWRGTQNRSTDQAGYNQIPPQVGLI